MSCSSSSRALDTWHSESITSDDRKVSWLMIGIECNSSSICILLDSLTHEGLPLNAWHLFWAIVSSGLGSASLETGHCTQRACVFVCVCVCLCIYGHKSLEKHSVSRLSYLFAHLDLLSSETFSFVIFFFLLFSSLTLPISAFHLSILSEVWLLNFLRSYIYHVLYRYLYIYISCIDIHFPCTLHINPPELCMGYKDSEQTNLFYSLVLHQVAVHNWSVQDGGIFLTKRDAALHASPSTAKSCPGLQLLLGLVSLAWCRTRFDQK